MESTLERRIQTLYKQLEPELDEAESSSSSAEEDEIESVECSFGRKKGLAEELRVLLDGEFSDIKNKTRQFIQKEKSFYDCYEMEYKQFRNVLTQWVKTTLDNRPIPLTDYRDNPKNLFAWVEILSMFNTNICVKLAVQWTLWGGSIMSLGTERHQHLIPKIEDLSLPGCFGMTEHEHGSNVRGIQTTATYDERTKEFIINTPTPAAGKYWIGNGAKDGQMMSVFARLIVKGKDHGVHIVLAPIRQNGKTYPGVTIKDIGYKMGLNGVDNGMIIFDHVRVPKENLLNRYADVDENGNYVCSLESESKNFGATVGSLTGGRVVIGTGGITTMKMGAAIAIRFGFARKQFGPPGGSEVPIMTYPTHQIRLMPILAQCYALDFFSKYVWDRYSKKTTATMPEVHSLTAGFKACATWTMSKALQNCRESCGGMGYNAKSRIPAFKADTDIFVTFEGDNMVLVQQTARYLLDAYAKMSKKGVFSGVLAHMGREGEVSNVVSEDPKRVWDNQRTIRNLLEMREAGLLKDLAAQIQSRVKSGMSQYEAWTSSLNQACELALAHMDRLIVANFIDQIVSSPHSVRPVLKLMNVLDGLVRIEENVGWYLANDLISSPNAKLLTSAIEIFSSELTEHALELVEAFGIPDKCLPRADMLFDA